MGKIKQEQDENEQMPIVRNGDNGDKYEVSVEANDNLRENWRNIMDEIRLNPNAKIALLVLSVEDSVDENSLQDFLQNLPANINPDTEVVLDFSSIGYNSTEINRCLSVIPNGIKIKRLNLDDNILDNLEESGLMDTIANHPELEDLSMGLTDLLSENFVELDRCLSKLVSLQRLSLTDNGLQKPEYDQEGKRIDSIEHWIRLIGSLNLRRLELSGNDFSVQQRQTLREKFSCVKFVEELEEDLDWMGEPAAKPTVVNEHNINNSRVYEDSEPSKIIREQASSVVRNATSKTTLEIDGSANTEMTNERSNSSVNTKVNSSLDENTRETINHNTINGFVTAQNIADVSIANVLTETRGTEDTQIREVPLVQVQEINPSTAVIQSQNQDMETANHQNVDAIAMKRKRADSDVDQYIDSLHEQQEEKTQATIQKATMNCRGMEK